MYRPRHPNSENLKSNMVFWFSKLGLYDKLHSIEFCSIYFWNKCIDLLTLGYESVDTSSSVIWNKKLWCGSPCSGIAAFKIQKKTLNLENSAVPNSVFEAPKYSSVSGHYSPNISPNRNFLSQSYSPSSTYACGGENNNTAPTANRNKFNQPIDTAKRPQLINGYPGLCLRTRNFPLPKIILCEIKSFITSRVKTLL